MSAEEEVLGKPYDARLMRRLLVYLRPYRGAVVFSLINIFLYSAFAALGPYYTKIAIDHYLRHSNATSPFDRFLSSDPVRGIGQLAAMYLFTLVAAFVVQYAQTY